MSDCAGEMERSVSVSLMSSQTERKRVFLYLNVNNELTGFPQREKSVTLGLLFLCKSLLEIKLNVAAQTRFFSIYFCLLTFTFTEFTETGNTVDSHTRLQGFSPAALTVFDVLSWWGGLLRDEQQTAHSP